MENTLAGLHITNDEEKGLQVVGVSEGHIKMYDLCLWLNSWEILLGGFEEYGVRQVTRGFRHFMRIKALLVRRAAIIESVWLQGGSVIGSGRNSFEAREVMSVKGFFVFEGINNINPILGMNLEGRSREGFGRFENFGLGFRQDPMNHDLKEVLIDSLEGKKRQMTTILFGRVSEILDLGRKWVSNQWLTKINYQFPPRGKSINNNEDYVLKCSWIGKFIRK
ncbi:hypothetical protein Gohar_003794 [Gossypium harknessii]|uniref:Uncharacterized protein n=1 Tax=Gossypium harknessii TaxID=34285 RepID=A0A7J9IC21_9ROSI|nr:hypothetical protein [Gossypium harknessii]